MAGSWGQQNLASICMLPGLLNRLGWWSWPSRLYSRWYRRQQTNCRQGISGIGCHHIYVVKQG